MTQVISPRHGRANRLRDAGLVKALPYLKPTDSEAVRRRILCAIAERGLVIRELSGTYKPVSIKWFIPLLEATGSGSFLWGIFGYIRKYREGPVSITRPMIDYMQKCEARHDHPE